MDGLFVLPPFQTESGHEEIEAIDALTVGLWVMRGSVADVGVSASVEKAPSFGLRGWGSRRDRAKDEASGCSGTACLLTDSVLR